MREQAKMPESSFQRAYLRQQKKENGSRCGCFGLCFSSAFLVLWEVAADLRWIDPVYLFQPCAGGEKRS